MKFKPFPEITTTRFFLRKIKESDCKTILFLRSDETINKFIERPENRKTKNIPEAIKFIKQIDENIETSKSIAWGITLKDDPQIIGTICLWNFSEDQKTAEIGYDLSPKFHGNGVMDEAMKSVIEYGFNVLNLDKIEAYTHQKNESSKKLLERNRFTFVKDKIDENNLNNIIYELKQAFVN